jgi:hypothetical protein
MLNEIIQELEAKIKETELDMEYLCDRDFTGFAIASTRRDAYGSVIEIIKQHEPPTITDEEIERMAKEFSMNNAFNSSFIPDIPSFIAGYKQALSMMPQSEGCEAKLTEAIERMDRARSILNKQDGSSNWGMLDTSYLLPHPPKK